LTAATVGLSLAGPDAKSRRTRQRTFQHAAPTAVLPDEEPPYAAGDATPQSGEAVTDASPLTLGLAAERVRALREALAAHARGVRPPAAELQALLRDASAAAHHRGIPAERLLVEFKLLWYALPEVRALRGPQQSEALGELVTICIEAYYSDA
jgi:hypothetical protein